MKACTPRKMSERRAWGGERKIPHSANEFDFLKSTEHEQPDRHGLCRLWIRLMYAEISNAI